MNAPTTSPRMLKLRRPGTCCICHTALEPGTQARWDPARTTVTCTECLDGTTPVQSGPAGGSAVATAERRRAPERARREAVKRAHPIAGRLALAILPSEDKGRSFATGAVGEQKLGAGLDRLASKGVLALHDRRLPGSVANIDHLVVAASGVWVVDAKRSKKATTLSVAGAPGPDQRLLVNGRNRSQELTKLDRQCSAVDAVLCDAGADEVVVHGVMCWVDTEMPFRQKALAVRGHLVGRSRDVRQRLLEPGPFDADDRAALLRLLARSFPPGA